MSVQANFHEIYIEFFSECTEKKYLFQQAPCLCLLCSLAPVCTDRNCSNNRRFHWRFDWSFANVAHVFVSLTPLHGGSSWLTPACPA